MHRLLLTSLVLSGCLLGSVGVASLPAMADDAAAARSHGDDDARARRGLEIAPVKLSLHGRDRAKVGLGSYLVNAVGGCNDCHTNPSYAAGGNPFLGQPKVVNSANYLAGGQKFGPFTSRNLTPEPDGQPAGLTLDQFKEVMRTGRDFDLAHPDISPLLQVMPWPSFQSMTDHDLEAIYEYLSAIPPAEPGTTP